MIDGHLDEDGKIDRLKRHHGRQDEHDLVELESESLERKNPHEEKRVEDEREGRADIAGSLERQALQERSLRF